MPPLPALFAPDVFDSLVVRTVHIPKGFLVMCNLLVIIANIWLTRTKNAHQNFALVSRAMPIDLSDSRRQPQNSWGLVVCASNEVVQDWRLQSRGMFRALPEQVS